LGLRPGRIPIKLTRLQDWPIGQHIGRHVDLMPCAVDQGNVGVFKILARRIMNDRRGIGAARRERGEQETSRDTLAQASYWRASFPAGIFCALGVIHFLMIMLGCRCDLVWHCGRKGNGNGKANHGNDERGYYNSG
jgi:hypothetical protein